MGTLDKTFLIDGNKFSLLSQREPLLESLVPFVLFCGIHTLDAQYPS